MNYLLIDLENIYPTWLDKLDSKNWSLIVFMGPNQKVLTCSFVKTLSKFKFDIVKVKKPGSNALDFHLTFELGKLSQTDPKGTYHILSKDKGYDSLVSTLKNSGLTVFRSEIIE